MMICQSSSRGMWTLLLVTLICLLQGIGFLRSKEDYHNENNSDVEHSRQKRLLFFTSDRLLSLPKGTHFLFDITISLPGIRNMPVGYANAMTLVADFGMTLDDFGYTSGENPFFFMPYIGFSGREFPGVNRAGGDRLYMYEALEEILESIGMEGKPCLLRAICEIFEVPLLNHGFLGEILELFLSVSRSPYAQVRLGDYIAAERAGRHHGNCSAYTDACLHSLFSTYVTDQPKSMQVLDESRQKRFIYFTRERRLTFPPGTVLIFSPVIQFPFTGNFPLGYTLLSCQISVNFQVLLDDLGLTSEENPWGVIEGLDEIFRKRRETIKRKSDPRHPGGDRDMFYHIVEDYLHNFGLDGKACMLRTICEMFQYPLDNHGFFGEFLELFFSASNSYEAEKRLAEYTAAERTGKTTGDCSAYLEDCPHSFFTNTFDAQVTDKLNANKGVKNQSTYWTSRSENSFFGTTSILGALIDYLESWL